MSRFVHLFVKTDREVDQFVAWLEKVLGKTFEKDGDANENWYTLVEPYTETTLFENTFKNDLGIDFEKYTVDISIRRRNVTQMTWEDITLNVGLNLFEKLKEQKQYSILLTDETSIVIQEYNSE